MNRRHACLPALCIFFASLSLSGADDDKSELFNTFYLDGDRVTHVLILRSGTPRTFELHGPDNNQISGTIRVSGEHITFSAGAVKRYFHYDLSGGNLKLGRRENDAAVKDSLLGEMPPASAAVFRTVYLSEENWKKKGRPVFGAKKGSSTESAKPAPPVVMDEHADAPVELKPEPVKLPPPSRPPEGMMQAIGSFNDICGVYHFSAEKGEDVLRINADGQFEYTRNDGAKQSGTLIRDESDLTFVTADHKRHVAIRVVEGGLEFKRRTVDVVKPHEVLGSMPPQDREPLVWTKKQDLTPKSTAPDSATVRNLSPALQEPIADAPADSPPAKANSDSAQPARTDAGAVRAKPLMDAKTIVGTYIHKHSAFVTETIEFTGDGTIKYSGSNGTAAAGTYSVDAGKLTIISDEVERQFAALADDKALILYRRESDVPKLKNDLATMSPTVLKNARYEKQ
jgi:hypothetical protein